MRVGKQRAPRRQSINIRSLGLRMPAKTPDPVIQVVDRDEQHIRPRISRVCFNARQDSKPKDDQSAFQGDSIAVVRVASVKQAQIAANYGAGVFWLPAGAASSDLSWQQVGNIIDFMLILLNFAVSDSAREFSGNQLLPVECPNLLQIHRRHHLEGYRAVTASLDEN